MRFFEKVVLVARRVDDNGVKSRQQRSDFVCRLFPVGGELFRRFGRFYRQQFGNRQFQVVFAAETENRPDAIWAVQIGAFSNYAKARVYAQKIRRRYENLNSRNAKVEPAENNAIIVYRSKLVNLTKNDAQKICKDLQKENKSCMVMPMNGNVQLTMAEK